MLCAAWLPAVTPSGMGNVSGPGTGSVGGVFRGLKTWKNCRRERLVEGTGVGVGSSGSVILVPVPSESLRNRVRKT